MPLLDWYGLTGGGWGIAKGTRFSCQRGQTEGKMKVTLLQSPLSSKHRHNQMQGGGDDWAERWPKLWREAQAKSDLLPFSSFSFSFIFHLLSSFPPNLSSILQSKAWVGKVRAAMTGYGTFWRGERGSVWIWMVQRKWLWTSLSLYIGWMCSLPSLDRLCHLVYLSLFVTSSRCINMKKWREMYAKINNNILCKSRVLLGSHKETSKTKPKIRGIRGNSSWKLHYPSLPKRKIRPICFISSCLAKS